MLHDTNKVSDLNIDRRPKTDRSYNRMRINVTDDTNEKTKVDEVTNKKSKDSLMTVNIIQVR